MLRPHKTPITCRQCGNTQCCWPKFSEADRDYPNRIGTCKICTGEVVVKARTVVAVSGD